MAIRITHDRFCARPIFSEHDKNDENIWNCGKVSLRVQSRGRPTRAIEGPQAVYFVFVYCCFRL